MSLIVDKNDQKGGKSCVMQSNQTSENTHPEGGTPPFLSAPIASAPEHRSPARWSFGRRLLAAVGVIVIGFVLLGIYGMLHPNLEYEAAREAEAAVALQLRDAGAAEYRNVNVYRLQSGKLLVCGEVSAPNAFGGLASYTRFISPGGGTALIEVVENDRATFDDLWATWGCTGLKGGLVASDVTILG